MAISPMRQARQKLRLERSWSVLRLKRCGGQCEASNSLEIRSLEQAQIGGGDRVQADFVKQPERRLVAQSGRSQESPLLGEQRKTYVRIELFRF